MRRDAHRLVRNHDESRYKLCREGFLRRGCVHIQETFKGVMAFGLQMIPVLGILVSAQFLGRPAVVQARNLEPVGCLDINQYEERFRLMGVTCPKRLRGILDKFVNKTDDEKVYGPMHHIMAGTSPPGRHDESKKSVSYSQRHSEEFII
jgi:hypothetical protein